MLEVNYYQIEKELLSLEVAVRDLLITGPKGSVHIDTTNSTMIPDTYEVLENNSLGLNLDKAFEIKIEPVDSNFYELIINNKMEESKMNHEIVRTIIKMGELKAILKNTDAEGKIKNNCIALAKNDCVLLRTNGAVIYGLYDVTNKGNFGHMNKNLIHFTHDLIKPEPFVNTADYRTMKPVVLKAYRQIFDAKAKQKLEAVRYIISNHNWYREKLNAISTTDNTVTNTTNATEPIATKPVDVTINTVAQEPIINTIKKVEVKTMDKELNVMSLAHKIRKELCLEGNYSAQMKMALSYAWAIKKGTATIESILGTTESAAHTYNADNKTVEPSVDNTNSSTVITNASDVQFELKMHEIEPGAFKLGITQMSTGAVKYYPRTVSSLNLAAAYIYVAQNIEAIVRNLPKNTRIVALPMTITACQTRQGLKDICKEKNLSYQSFKPKNVLDEVASSAPSGEAV